MKTRKIPYTLLSLLLFSLSASAQLPSIDWSKKFGSSLDDISHAIRQLPDSSFIVLGSVSGGDGDITDHRGGGDAVLLKLSAKGEKMWVRNLGGNNVEQGADLQLTPDGGFILAAITHSDTGEVIGHHGKGDAWVVKTDSLGNIEWQKCLGGSEYDGAASIRITTDGGYIMAGFTRSNDGDVSGFHKGTYGYESDVWIVKLSANGDIEWQKALGGTGDDYATSVIQTSDGYVVSGSTASRNGNVTGQRGEVDMWVIKLKNTGTLQWQKCLGGSLNDHGHEILQTPDGGFIIAGSSNSKDKDVTGGHGDYDFWIVRLNSAGALQWQKCLGGQQAELAGTIRSTSDEGYVVGGYTRSTGGDVVGHNFKYDGWLVKINKTGQLVWQRCFGGSENDYIYALIPTLDGKFAFVGSSFSSDEDITNHIGNNDIWIVKVGNNGELPQNATCDSIDMCLGWLRDTIAHSLAEAPEENKLVIAEHAKWDGADIIIARGRVDNFDFYDVIFDCKGRVLQRCPYSREYGCDPSLVRRSLIYSGSNYKIRYDGITILDTIWQQSESFPVCRNNSWIVQPTSISHTIILPQQIMYNMNSNRLYPNDQIGFFYQHEGREYCAGYGTWTGEGDLTIQVYGNDAVAPAKNGFAIGDTLKIKVWHGISLQEEAITEVTYLEPGSLNGLLDATNQFKEDAYSGISMLGTPQQTCLDIKLKAGVNYISSYLLPTETIPVLIDTIKNKMIEWKNDQGAAIIPAFEIYDESLENWVITEGYKVTMADSATLNVCGAQTNTAFMALPIEPGIQWIAYLKQVPSSPASALAAWASCISWVKNAAGESYIPVLNPPGNMRFMEPTQGYKIKAACSDDIYFRDEPEVVSNLQHFNQKVNTGTDATIVIPAHVIQYIAAPGNEVGVFSRSGVLCGAANYEGKNFYITIWGDDPSTTITEGLREGEEYELKLWNAQEQKEIKLEVELQRGLPQFQPDALQVLQSAAMLTTDVSEAPKSLLQWALYPNPAKDQITIQFAVPLDEAVLEILSGDGKTLQRIQLPDQTQQQNVVVANLPVGMYWCKLTTQNNVFTKRFVITK